MRKLALILSFGLLLASPLFATNGYFVHGTGTASKAMAGASVALPQEALDADTNPAAAVFVPGGYSFSLALFSPDRQYTVIGNPSGYPQTFGLQPGTVSSKSNYFPMPGAGLNLRPNDRSAVTFNFTAHGGMNTDYRTDTFYGSDHTGVDLAQMFLTATYSRLLTERQAFGISAIIAGQRFKASGLEAFGAFSGEPECLTGNGYEWSKGIGVKVGYLARVHDSLTIGASFNPAIQMSELDAYCGLFAEEGGFDVPASGTIGLAYKPIEPLTFALDYQRIHYTDVRAVGNGLIPNLMNAPLGSDDGPGFGWSDVDVYKLGVQWKASENWTWRAGYSTNNQPIRSGDVLFNILAPGVVDDHITLGLSKTLANRPGRFNMAVMYAPAKSVRGPNPLEAPGAQSIELKMSEWELEFGYSFGF